MSITVSLERIVHSRDACAAVLQGRWGRGKTHAWNAVWDRYSAQMMYGERPSVSYSYVSLFGVETMAELKTSIYINTQTPSVVPPLTKFSGWVERGRRLMPNVKRVLSNAEKLDPKKLAGLSAIMQAIGSYATKNMLICIDDIERRGKGLRLLDVLGLISNLVERKNCRVIAILNPDSLDADDARTWAAQREKVFDSEMTFDPTPMDCANMVFGEEPNSSIEEFAKRDMIDLGVTNIRIIERSARTLRAVIPLTKLTTRCPEGLEYISRSVCLLVYCNFGHGEGAPTIRFVEETAHMGYRKTEGLTVEESYWSEFLQSYDYYFPNRIDTLLKKFVVHGQIEAQEFEYAYDLLIKYLRSGAAKATYESAWNLWHNSFVDNKEAVLEAFRAALPLVIETIGPNDANSVAHFLHERGEAKWADDFARAWVDVRARWGRIEELRNSSLNAWTNITYPALIEYAKDAYSKRRPLRAISHLFEAYAVRKVDELDAESLAASAVDDIREYILINQNTSTNEAIRYCLTLGATGREPYVAAREKIVAVLRDIAASSEALQSRLRDRFPTAFDNLMGDAAHVNDSLHDGSNSRP